MDDGTLILSYLFRPSIPIENKVQAVSLKVLVLTHVIDFVTHIMSMVPKKKSKKVGPTRTYQNLQFTTFLAHHFIIPPKKINMGPNLQMSRRSEK